ncbi:MAG: hypothetical protein WCI78_16790 [Mycobacterium sp.]
MKLLTVYRPDRCKGRDFCHGISGELAMPITVVCDNPRCGCDRSLVGLASGKGSTTVKVAELGFTRNDLLTAVIAYLENSGWADVLGCDDKLCHVAQTMTAACAKVAARYDTGTVLRPSYDHETNTWSFTEADM